MLRSSINRVACNHANFAIKKCKIVLIHYEIADRIYLLVLKQLKIQSLKYKLKRKTFYVFYTLFSVFQTSGVSGSILSMFSKHYEYCKTGALDIILCEFFQIFERRSFHDFHEYKMSMRSYEGEKPLVQL